jgi:ABC-type transport system substrate-binding protein
VPPRDDPLSGAITSPTGQPGAGAGSGTAAPPPPQSPSSPGRAPTPPAGPAAAPPAAPPGTPPDPLLGRTVAGFRIDARLGQGGMGTVYRATQMSLGRPVALKVLASELSADPEFSERFRREARAAALLDHPHVVQPIDFFEGEGRLFFAMELMEGGCAADRIGQGRRYIERDAVEIAIAVARALEYAEARGIVHRDLKPANILFSKHGTPKVADMGLVLDREQAATQEALTRPGYAQGTPEYMSPEQAQGRRDLDVRSDLYALGVALFELLSGRRPFDGPDGMSIALQHVTTPVPDVRTVAADVSPQLAAVIARMTAKRREDRYRSAEEARRALESTRAEIAVAPDVRELPGRASRARVGLRLVAIDALDLPRGRFAVELDLTVSWRGSRDAGEARVLAAGEPRVEEIGRVEEGSWRRVARRVRAEVRGDFAAALEDYPYDAHVLRIEVEHPSLSAEDLVLAVDPERTGLAPGLDLPGFRFERTLRASERREPAPAAALRLDAGTTRAARAAGASGERSRLCFELRIARLIGPYVLRVGSPYLVPLAIALAAPWSESPILAGALALVTSLLADAVAARHVPPTTGATVADLHAALGRAAALGVLVATAGMGFLLRTANVGSGFYTAFRVMLEYALPAAAVLGAALLGFPAGRPLILGPLRRWRRGARAPRAAAADEGAAAPAAPRPAALRSTREELVVGLLHAPTRLVEGCVTTTDHLATRFLVEGPVEYDARLNLLPRLAAEVPTYENGRMEALSDGGVRVRWRLRPNLRWGDGTPIVPEDALAAHELRPIPRLSTRGPGIEVVDGEVVLTYEGPRPGAAADLRLFPSRHAARFKGAEGAARFGTSEIPPLAGPFILRSWTPGEDIVCERNPHYMLGPAALARVRLRFFRSRDALVSAFAAREVQLVPESVLEPGEADALARRTPGAEARRRAAPKTFFLVPNLDDPTLADRRVRQALLLAIDREALVRLALDGYGRVAHSWLPPQHEGYLAGIPRYACDPGRAARLLDEAGFRPGRDGRRRGPDGRPLTLEVARAERHPGAAVDFLSGAAWGPLGITVVPRLYKEAEYFREVLVRRRFAHLAFLGYVVDPWETGRELFSADRIPCAENEFQGRNFSGWRSAAATELHRRIDASHAEEERAELFERQQRLWAQELPLLPLYRPEEALVLGAGLRGVVLHAGGEYALPWNAEEWRFAEE